MDQLRHALGLMGFRHLAFEMWWKHKRAFEPKTAWNDRQKAFFVHIPKTAGTSIYDSFAMDKLPFTHAPARILQDLYPQEFADCFTFTFVRNPWDRFVSTFEFLKRETVWPEQKLWAETHIGDLAFRDFVLKLERDYVYRSAILSYNFFFTQHYFLSNRKGALIVDRILRFEDIAAGFQELAERFNVATRLTHSRKTSGRVDFNQYYDAETREIVGRLYRADVMNFDY